MASLTATVDADVRPIRSRIRRGWLVLAVLAAWVVLWFPLRGRHTLALSTAKSTPLQERVNDFRHWVDLNRYSNPFLTDVIGVIRDAIDRFATFLQSLLSTPSDTRPVPLIGWLGVVVLAGFIAYAVANWQMALLTVVGFSCFNLLGLWRESMDTLALLIAAVLISVVIGIPLGIGVGLSPRLRRAVTPVLDFMQTMPTFVYLAPLALFFSIGAASGVIATIIYALPPVIRITAFGIGEVPGETLEAGESLGATGWQSLRKVRLPLARRMILVGVNQTTMCALSMVTIAALINAPGLGDSTIVALRHDDVGEGFRAGLAIVIMAIVLDRVTTAAGERARTHTSPEVVRRRRIGLAVGGVVTLASLYLAYTFTWAAFPPAVDSKGGLGQPLVDAANAVDEFIRAHFSQITNGIRDGFTTGVFNPFENLFTQAPWYLTVVLILALAWLLGGVRVLPVTAVCLALLLGTGLWSDAMATLAAVLVASAVTILGGVVVGVWLGRSRAADRIVRPVLDAAQVLPAFVYLVPALGLFGPTRFTAMASAVVFAAPVVIKLVAEGIRRVPATVVESATASGSSRWQIITKVQLPLARGSIGLAANQGLIYVLSMVVVGGLVGGGALGYLVVAGRAQTSYFGKGLAAGVAIVLLGVLLDRITQAAARRADPRVARTGP